MKNRNHEGYMDITASTAIRRIDRKRHHGSGARLMYRIGDLQIFKDILRNRKML